MDGMFWIGSMTKAVTTAGAMQLAEQGKLSLDAPIGEVLPDLAKPKVLEGFNANGASRRWAGTRRITLGWLMTHTAGFCCHHVERRLAAWRTPARRRSRWQRPRSPRIRHALGIRHQHRFRRQGRGGRQLSAG
ncbi:serine hydrolase [Bradyrhizobium sp. 62B]|uniref:serine hydrolase n=1 Tax=Bradyrhizobium sp. 62B TaxID=2898442 RepID=UPI002557EB25